MKRIFIAMACLVAVVYICGCGKSTPNIATCSGTKPALDSTALLAYAKQNGITPTMDTSFLYYQVITPGSGAAPSPNSVVYVRYVAKFLDGSYLDSSAVSTGFPLGNLILGWQYGLPKIMPGGRIKLLIPSALAYGCGGSSNVQPNTPLFFDIYLDSLK